MKILATIFFLIPGVINFAPVVGALSAKQLTRLYQIDNLSQDLELLLRHRAFLFGIIGTFIIISAFQPNLRIHATIAGLVSMVSFIVLAFTLNIDNPSLVKIVWVDVFAIVVLLVGFTLHIRSV